MINNNPKVSIMISVYNQLHCLDKALISALDQTYDNIEIVIADDCSTDGDVNAAISKYSNPKIKYFRNEENLGVSGNFRRLLNTYSSGDLALMLNADDYLIKNDYIEQAVKLFVKDEAISLVFGDIKIFVERTGEFISDSCNKSLPEVIDGNTFFLNYWKGYSLPHLTSLYDRAYAMSLGFYVSESISADLESFFRLVMNKNVGYINVPVGVLSRHQQNFTKSVSSFFGEPASDFIDKPYEYALNNTTMDHNALNNWRLKMLKRYYLKILVKLQFLSPEKISEYQSLIHERHPEVYQEVVKDIRYRFFRMISSQPRLLRFVFRTVFKQESFIADLLAQRK